MSSSLTPHRGDIYLVNFEPTIGAEIKKTRPAVIIQNDIGNTYSPLTIVAAITSQTDEQIYPTEVPIPKGTANLDVNSLILLGQIRTIDKNRLIKKIGSVDVKTLEQINTALLVSLGLVEL
jgi:mRNA interferase MazF